MKRNILVLSLHSIKDVGVAFSRGSYLELRNPPHLMEQLASRTYVSMYFNIARSEVQKGKAFIFYMGNEEKTHTE